MKSSINHCSVGFNTERALDLIAARGVPAYVVKAEAMGGASYGSPVRAGDSFWAQRVGPALAGELERSQMYRPILGGEGLHDFCMEIAAQWAEATGEDGFYTFDPEFGLLFSKREEGGGRLLMAHRSDFVDDPKVLVEWASEDWSEHGLWDADELIGPDVHADPLYVLDHGKDDMRAVKVGVLYDINKAVGATCEGRVQAEYTNPHMILPLYLGDNPGALKGLVKERQHLRWSQMNDAVKIAFRLAEKAECEAAPTPA